MEEFFWRNFLGGFFWEDFFWGGFLEDFFGRTIWRIFWEEFFVYIGIDLFVKILSKSKEEEEFRSLEVRVQAYRT